MDFFKPFTDVATSLGGKALENLVPGGGIAKDFLGEVLGKDGPGGIPIEAQMQLNNDLSGDTIASTVNGGLNNITTGLVTDGVDSLVRGYQHRGQVTREFEEGTNGAELGIIGNQFDYMGNVFG